MRFNGTDPRDIHSAIGISKEIPPGMATRRIRTLQASDGEIVTGADVEGGRYILRVNIAGRTIEEGWAVREMIAAWAGSSGAEMAALEPTHRPGRCYDAIAESISDPEYIRGFAVVDVTFFIPRPISRSVKLSCAKGAGKVTALIGGSSPARPIIRQTISKARSGVTWTMDGHDFLRLNGEFSAGQVIEMDTSKERLTVDRENAMTLIDPQKTRWRPGFAPGMHGVESTDGGEIEMRWHDEWL